MKSKLLSALLALAFVFSSSSCGTLMFSHRHGQSSGRIDANVVILDSIGLLFFLVPGLVAFGVDFASGSIYLPEDVEMGEGPFIIDQPKVEVAD